jgi:hypothetical protein
MSMTLKDFFEANSDDLQVNLKQIKNKTTYIRKRNKDFGTIDNSNTLVLNDDECKELYNQLKATVSKSNQSTYKLMVPKIEVLEKENENLKNQLEESKELSSNLQRLLENQQVLNKQLQDNLNKATTELDFKTAELVTEKSKGFWAKLFGK